MMNRKDIHGVIRGLGSGIVILTTALLIFVGIKGISISGDETDPYSEGTHWQYQIRCENGFVYKVRGKEGAIQILNSDGTPLRCGEKIY